MLCPVCYSTDVSSQWIGYLFLYSIAIPCARKSVIKQEGPWISSEAPSNASSSSTSTRNKAWVYVIFIIPVVFIKESHRCSFNWFHFRPLRVCFMRCSILWFVVWFNGVKFITVQAKWTSERCEIDFEWKFYVIRCLFIWQSFFGVHPGFLYNTASLETGRQQETFR